ncbi:MAG: hypothetical protein KJN93_09715 [Alphaproteobacteria bacterium]|nr:hypothetical protein [Alphaproteobacteria bacterium]
MRNGSDAEAPRTIFFVMSKVLFNPRVTGFLYAALLAAIMSPVSSQLLVPSSSLAEDVCRLLANKDAQDGHIVPIGRFAGVAIGVAAAFIARDADSRVLGLVAVARAGFGAASGPLIILSPTWRRMNGLGAAAGMVTGDSVVMGWIALGWNESFLAGPSIYEIIPPASFWRCSSPCRKPCDGRAGRIPGRNCRKMIAPPCRGFESPGAGPICQARSARPDLPGP